MSAIIVPARYASTRLPGKMLQDLGGKPVIVRTVEQCLKTKADRVIVVTDDERIRVALAGTPVDVVMSDPKIATGTDRVVFAAAGIDDDVIINVQGDEPFIPLELINALIDQLEYDNALQMNSACTPFLNNDDALNPSHVKVVFDKDKYALYFSRSLIPCDRDGKGCVRYRHIGIYGFRRSYLLGFPSLPQSALENIEMLEQLRVLESGGKIKLVVTDYQPVSIDTQADLDRARELFVR